MNKFANVRALRGHEIELIDWQVTANTSEYIRSVHALFIYSDKVFK
ncbi:MAG: hypothetical protein PUC50_02465 [Bacteroidales bacterium]|nr:hypothetical protein [Bacteroidales bacterium]